MMALPMIKPLNGIMSKLKFRLLRAGFGTMFAVAAATLLSLSSAAAGSDALFSENFEGETMIFSLATTGDFPSAPGVQNGMGTDGSRGFGFGRSSCGSTALRGYMNTLTLNLNGEYSILKNATVKNLSIRGGRIEGRNRVGGIAGRINGGTTITDCTIDLETERRVGRSAAA